MSEIIEFIKENTQEIIIIVFVVLFMLVLINIKDIDLNAPKPETKLVQQVTVETFASDDLAENAKNIIASSTDNFCDSYLGNSEKLEKACNQLTEGNCAQVKCCVFTNERCVAGDISGPTYKTDKDGKLITIDSYYYLGKYQSNRMF